MNELRVIDLTKNDEDLLRAIASEYRRDARLAVADRLDAIAARCPYAERLTDLLRRIYGWDVMDSPHGDGAYWRHEIEAALAENPNLAGGEVVEGPSTAAIATEAVQTRSPCAAPGVPAGAGSTLQPFPAEGRCRHGQPAPLRCVKCEDEMDERQWGEHGTDPLDLRDCICADPENCTQEVPGYRCRRKPAAPEIVQERCGWYQQDEDGDVWGSGCGEEFHGDGEPGNWMKFCPFCGKVPTFTLWSPADDEDDAATPSTGAQR